MSEEERLDFDKIRAHHLVGKSVLIGFTYVDENGEVTNQRQYHGTIVGAHEIKRFDVD
jgi:hypothetical protein